MKFCVIGLGRLGFQVATVLSENGMEVIAVDSDETIVANIRDLVTTAICMRVTNEECLRSIGIDEIDTAIVATGENFAESVLITALLKKIKTPRVIARAINDIHKEILTLIGADQVFIPEHEVGTRLADNLSSPFTDLVRLAPHFSISQLITPQRFVGKTPHELNLYQNYEVRYIGTKKDSQTIVYAPDEKIQPKDRIILSGENEKLEAVTKL